MVCFSGELGDELVACGSASPMREQQARYHGDQQKDENDQQPSACLLHRRIPAKAFGSGSIWIPTDERLFRRQLFIGVRRISCVPPVEIRVPCYQYPESTVRTGKNATRRGAGSCAKRRKTGSRTGWQTRVLLKKWCRMSCHRNNGEDVCLKEYTTMKTNLLSLSLAALLFSAPLSAAHAQTTGKPSLPIKTLHAIQENVQAAQQNAHIYQWVRVNQEVDRVVADAHKVEKALAGNSALAQQGTE